MNIVPALTTARVLSLSAILACSVFSAVLAQDVTTVVDTSDAVQNAPWAENVTITMNDDADTFTFDSDGVPSHGYAEQYLNPTGTPVRPSPNIPLINSIS